MPKLRAIFKDDAIRCEKCGVEIWEGVDCDCGIDGADHEGLTEAYKQKRDWTTMPKLSETKTAKGWYWITDDEIEIATVFIKT
jgi:hypothetical protein